MYFTSGGDRAFEQLMQQRPGADHFDSGDAGAPEDCGDCRFYRPDWKYQFCVYAECPYQPGKLTALDAVKFQVKGVDDEMAVFRVEKNRGYTVMSNHHLRNKDLSLKAKGLLSQMLSLPENWDYETYFLSMTDEADLLAAAEAAGVEQAACSCSEKCAAGAVNTDCPVCAVNMTECAGVEPEPVETEETGEPAPEEAEPETGGNMGMLLLVLAVAVIGGGAGWYFKIYRPKHEKAAEPEEDYGGELDGYDGGEPYGDEEDDGPPWDEEDDDGEEAGK